MSAIRHIGPYLFFGVFLLVAGHQAIPHIHSESTHHHYGHDHGHSHHQDEPDTNSKEGLLQLLLASHVQVEHSTDAGAEFTFVDASYQPAFTAILPPQLKASTFSEESARYGFGPPPPPQRDHFIKEKPLRGPPAIG